jgi:hypothetical protein
MLPGRALIVADTHADVSALTWALRLVGELGALGQRLPLVLSSYSAQLGAEAVRFEQLPGVSSVHTLGAQDEPRAFRELAPAAGGLWVLVGQPALLACDAWLSVLLGIDTPVLRWADGLRGLRGRLTLELSGSGLEMTNALARAIATP